GRARGGEGTDRGYGRAGRGAASQPRVPGARLGPAALGRALAHGALRADLGRGDLLPHPGLPRGAGEHRRAVRVHHDRLGCSVGVPVLGLRPVPDDRPRRPGHHRRRYLRVAAPEAGPARAAPPGARRQARMTRHRPLTSSAALFTLLLTGLWSGLGIAIKVGLEDAPPLRLGWLRFVVGALTV